MTALQCCVFWVDLHTDAQRLWLRLLDLIGFTYIQHCSTEERLSQACSSRIEPPCCHNKQPEIKDVGVLLLFNLCCDFLSKFLTCYSVVGLGETEMVNIQRFTGVFGSASSFFGETRQQQPLQEALWHHRAFQVWPLLHLYLELLSRSLRCP